MSQWALFASQHAFKEWKQNACMAHVSLLSVSLIKPTNTSQNLKRYCTKSYTVATAGLVIVILSKSIGVVGANNEAHAPNPPARLSR